MTAIDLRRLSPSGIVDRFRPSRVALRGRHLLAIDLATH
jgi:hypothetical protein